LWGEREGMMGSEEEDGGNGEEITQTLHAHMNKRKKSHLCGRNVDGKNLKKPTLDPHGGPWPWDSVMEL
jgi:hypothetical protein